MISFEEILADVRQVTLDAYRHQDVPFERIVEALSPQRQADALPFVNAVFALQNAPSTPTQLRGPAIKPIHGDTLHVRADIEVHAYENKRRDRAPMDVPPCTAVTCSMPGG